MFDKRSYMREYMRGYYSRNRDKILAKNRERYAASPELQHKNQMGAKRYKLAKLHRTPGWDLHELTDLIYKECPEGYEVDHVIPLRGKYVSGLRVYNNLQYLTREANARKHNHVI